MNSIDFNQLPGFSKLFTEFLAGNNFIQSRFPKQDINNKNKLFNSIASKSYNRNLIVSAVRESMHSSQFTSNQLNSIEKLQHNNSLAVVTGQQVGFLGGPLYTFYKLKSAINLASSIEQETDEFSFIPIFWVEDNDHDSLEAGNAHLYNGANELSRFIAEDGIINNNRAMVSTKTFDLGIEQLMNEIYSIINQTGVNVVFDELLRRIYQIGNNWTDAFIQFYNSILCDTGLLFLKASIAGKLGMFAENAEKELENPGKSNEIINQTNKSILENGFHIQARSSFINLFYHESGKRFNIEPENDSRQNFIIQGKKYEHNDLLNLFKLNPNDFSPKVLLRPVFQDSILPTAAYISGPSEIGYAAQIKELYSFFNVDMPIYVPRHSATIIDKRTQRFLEKKQLQPLFFFRDYNLIEVELKNIMFGEVAENTFINSINKLNQIYEELNILISSIDTSLLHKSETSLRKSTDIMIDLKKKVISIQKHKDEESFIKYKSAANFIYPKGNLQERILTLANFLSYMDYITINDKVEQMVSQNYGKHYFIYL